MAQTVQSHPATPSARYASACAGNSTTKWHINRGLYRDGYTLAAEQTFGNVLAFFRYGHSSGGAAGLKNMVAGGFGLLNMFGRKNDVLGIGASWGDPFDPAQRDQHGGEIYYRLQLTNNVAVTPHVQFIFDPADNLAEDRITLFGVRVRKEM